MSGLYLSRIRLKSGAAVAALARLLMPEGTGARAAASHHLVWSLFADDADRRRDFLWRQEGEGRFLALSSRPPQNPLELFEVQTKPFEPNLSVGDRLGFSLRANPVVARRVSPEGPSKRHDVVMDALRYIPPSERAERRLELVQQAGQEWLARQGAAHGFEVEAVGVDGYDRVRLPREGKGQDAVFGVMDFQGVLVVRDPALFLARLPQGFGRARAFGHGLMLIRRAA